MTWFQTQTLVSLVTVMCDSLFSLLWMWVCCWIKLRQSWLMMTLRRPLSMLPFITLAETKEVKRWWQHLISAMKRDATQSLPELVAWVIIAAGYVGPPMPWSWPDNFPAFTALLLPGWIDWKLLLPMQHDRQIFWQNIYACGMVTRLHVDGVGYSLQFCSVPIPLFLQCPYSFKGCHRSRSLSLGGDRFSVGRNTRSPTETTEFCCSPTRLRVRVALCRLAFSQ